MIPGSAAVAVALRPGRFDPLRIRWIPRGGRLLVVDRVSGQWVLRAPSDELLLRLVGCFTADIPPGLRVDVQRLRDELEQQQIGVVGSERHFDDLTTLIVKVTAACNLACTYCYDYESEASARRIDFSHAQAAIAEALELVPADLWVIFHGGEPMLAWQTIEDLVLDAEARAGSLGKRVHFTGQTNMTRLTDRIARFSLDHDIAWGLSLDGPPELHDAARIGHGGLGSYELFERSLRAFPGFVRRAGVMSTITAVNQHRLLEVVEHVRDLGFSLWDWSLFQPVGRGSDLPGQHDLDVEAVLASWSRLFDAVIGGRFDGFEIAPVLKYAKNFVFGPGDNMCMRAECGAGRDLLSISADGTIEACDCIDPHGPLAGLGSLATSTLSDARASARNMEIRRRDTGHRQCADCIWFGVCGGTCMAHAGSVQAVWVLGCELAKLAFDRISSSIAEDDALVRYMMSVGEDPIGTGARS